MKGVDEIRKRENIKKESIRDNTITEVKNNRLEDTAEQMHVLEDRVVETIQAEQKRNFLK